MKVNDVTFIGFPLPLCGADILSGCAFVLKFRNDACHCPLHKKYTPKHASMKSLKSIETIQM